MQPALPGTSARTETILQPVFARLEGWPRLIRFLRKAGRTHSSRRCISSRHWLVLAFPIPVARLRRSATFRLRSRASGISTNRPDANDPALRAQARRFEFESLCIWQKPRPPPQHRFLQTHPAVRGELVHQKAELIRFARE